MLIWIWMPSRDDGNCREKYCFSASPLWPQSPQLLGINKMLFIWFMCYHVGISLFFRFFDVVSILRIWKIFQRSKKLWLNLFLLLTLYLSHFFAESFSLSDAIFWKIIEFFSFLPHSHVVLKMTLILWKVLIAWLWSSNKWP